MLVMMPVPPLVVGVITEMLTTEDYHGVYFSAHHAGNQAYYANCHISLMHSRVRQMLSDDQAERVLRRAMGELRGLPIVVYGDMNLVWNDDMTLRRAWQNLTSLGRLTETMWNLRNMVCNFVPRYGERRRDFHISFDRVL